MKIYECVQEDFDRDGTGHAFRRGRGRESCSLRSAAGIMDADTKGGC